MPAREFFTSAEILDVGSPALPSDKGGLSRLIEERGWRNDPRRARLLSGRGRGGGTWEYHLSLLPAEVRAKLMAAEAGATPPPAPPRKGEGSKDAWARYEALPEKAKAEARARLAAVDEVDTLSAGMARAAAVALVARQRGIAGSTLWGWLRLAAEAAREDRLPALAPRRKGRTETKPCDARAWDVFLADYLRPEQPGYAACYRRLKDVAAAQGWTDVPSLKSLQRRLEREIPRPAIVLARKGAQAASAIYPHQTRDKQALAALEAVNADGHRFDVFVRWEDGEIGRVMMTAFQDVHSGMILTHRLDRSENWTAVRLCIADLVERFGIPDHAIFDNGRHFASKWLTGGTKTRFRFKVRDEDPRGILPELGVQVHFATPYHGQAKPIERAFRDLCEDIAKHPACAGAYTGNKPDAKPENYGSKALPIAEFRALAAAEIERHNQRPGRRSAAARGRSFAETFAASFGSALVRKASAAQRRLLLMAAEGVTASKRSGEVMLAENRYWAEPLAAQAGRKLTVRFDPQDLSLPVAIYSLDSRFLCEAPCIEQSGFLDVDAARQHGRLKRDWVRAAREQLARERRLGIAEVAALLPPPEPSHTPEPNVIRLVVNGQPLADAPDDTDAERMTLSSDRLARLFGEATILSFPKEEGGRG